MTVSNPAELPARMKAAVWQGGEPRLTIETIPVPVPKAGEALVKVTACGVCHTDLHVMKGEVAFPSPAVIGHEISGVVVRVGEGTDPDAAPEIGSHVAGAFIMPCGTCEFCLRGRDDLCADFFAQNRLKGTLYDGETRLKRDDGTPIAMYSMAGMAEYSVVPITALTPLPPELPEDASAILGCAAMTAYGAAVRAAELQEGESMAVVAVGGVGSSILQVGRALGAYPIIAVDVDDTKLELAKKLGAHFTVNSLKEDAVAAVRHLAGDRGVDVAFEALGRPETFTQATKMLADGGRMVAVGIAAGTATAQVEITPLVRRGQRIIGSFGARTRHDLPAVTALAAGHGFDVAAAVTRRYTLDQADEAYAALARGEIEGRAVVVMEPAD
jgi:S-(hydroxymethyl)glutathione dehydrogenase/alcohol dehydrogenase